MASLYLVRHGQASFGAADYDQLSELGQRQCERLGRWFAGRRQRFAAVLRGSLRRHEQSLAAFAGGYGTLPEVLVWPGLNEYDSHAVIRTIHAGTLEAPRSRDEYRQHFRLLREGLAQWMQGQAQPEGMPTFADFRAGVLQALEQARAHHPGDVLLVSSGGPIATAVAAVLGAPAEAAIELNMRIRNSAVTEFASTSSRHLLHTFNQLPHLDESQHADWVTYT